MNINIGKTSEKLEDIILLTNMTNRHGLVAGATGTGKTVTLQKIAESLSDQGVPVFAADIKGDLSGISQQGGNNEKITNRINELKLENFVYANSPIEFWDVFAEQGTPIRSTISEMGPIMMSRLLGLSDVQEGVLNIVFKYCDDNGILLLDLIDLQSAVTYVGQNAKEFSVTYGNVATTSIGAIQRGLLELQTQHGETFFGEPAISILDFMKTNAEGKGIVNLLCADKLFLNPKLYSTFMLWLLSELYENLPEVGDLDKPKLVFFFDEAHLLFKEITPELLTKVEQVIRLIRSKGVGIFFVTQNPADIPETVLAQLGNRVQHALRAYTPNELKGVKAAANSFRPNPDLDVEKVITELNVGEALISFLDEKGAPCITQRGFVIPPKSHIGAIDPALRTQLRNTSLLNSQYSVEVNRESALEIFTKRADEKAASEEQIVKKKQESEMKISIPDAGRQAPAAKKAKAPGRQRESVAEAVFKSTARAAGSQIGRSIVRSILGSIFSK